MRTIVTHRRGEELPEICQHAAEARRSSGRLSGRALAEKLLERSAESPVLGERAEVVELRLAHVPVEDELLSFGVEFEAVLKLRRDARSRRAVVPT